MDDYVGDILAGRQELEGGAAPAIFLSLLFHGILSALAAWSAWHVAHQQTPSVMMIRFAKAPVAEMTPAAPAVSAAPVQPAKPVEQPKPKPKEKTVPFSPFGKSAKKGREEPAPRQAVAAPAPVSAAPVTSTAQQVPIGGSGVTALEGGDFPYTLYIENMKRLVGTRWFRPQVAGDTSTTVYFVIERDGSIHEAKTEINSSNGLFDRAALRAVLESSPLPPLPFGYSGTYLGVHLKFR